MEIKNDINWLKEHRFVTEVGTPEVLDSKDKLKKYITQIRVASQLDSSGSGGPNDFKSQYLTFEALEDGTFTLNRMTTYTGNISYSLDNGATWISLDRGTSTPTVSAGSKVLLKGDYRSSEHSTASTFSSTCKFNASGNIMSLMYGDDFEDKTDLTGCDYCFKRLFGGYGVGGMIVDASNLVLPATTLANGCYEYMFENCTSLTTAPELPATTLAEYCYSDMFYNCTSLTTAPELPATTLATGCYRNMFYNCSNLNYIKAMLLSSKDYLDDYVGDYEQNWMSGVSYSGTFVKNSAATWSKSGAYIPSGWTIETADA